MRLQNADIGMPKYPTIAGRVIEAGVYALLTAFFLCVGFISTFGALDTITAAIKALGVLLLLLAMIYALYRFEPHSRALIAGILVLAAVLRIGDIFAVPTSPVSDFAVLYNAACSTANGDVSWMNVAEGYFSWWQYQIPFVLYEAAIIKLTHSVAALKLLNVVWSVGIVYMVYCIAGLYMPRRASLIASALCAVYPGHILMSSVLTNQHISLFFILIGVYVCLRADSLLKYAASGLLLAVGDMMRPEAGIVVAAIICVCLLAAIGRPTKKRILWIVYCSLRCLLQLAVLIAAYLGAKKLTELALQSVGLAPYGIGNSVPEWKLIVGLNMENNGALDDKYLYVLNITDVARRTEEAQRIIRAHLSQHGWGKFFYQKLKYFWTFPEDLTFTLAGVNEWDMAFGRVNITYTIYEVVFVERIIRALCYLSAAVGCAVLARDAITRQSKDRGTASILTAAIMCGTVVAYLLVEIQQRYRFFAIPFLLMLAAYPFKIKIQHKK